MAKLHAFSIAVISACAVFSHTLMGQTIDIEYLKKKNPELYRQLMEMEQCRTQPQQSACQDATAQTSPAAVAAPEAKAAAEAPKPQGKWWYASSYADQGPMEQWQHAVLVTADLMTMNGNTEGEQFHIELDYFSRLNTWTNFLTLIYEKDDVKQSDIVALDKTHYAFNYGGRYDFNPTWYGQGGYILEKDTTQSIDRQQVYYLGGGAHIINSDAVDLNTMLALGRQHDKFINAQDVGIGSLDYSVAYFVEQLSWHISRSISINQSFSWVHSLETIPEFAASTLSGGGLNPQCISSISGSPDYCIIDNVRKSKLGFTLGLEYQINAYISLLYNFAYEKDNVPWIGVEGTDTNNSLSIRASFQ